ncbi:Putative uncharacterized protein [Lacticaseibacillus paracasei]|nr:Putative uncharacterized protein [Lacticaseibacillus paracasei]
MPFVIDTASNN